MKLTLHETMWFGDAPVLSREHPIQNEVRGLPPDHEGILVGQNLDVRPIRWTVLRTRDGVRNWDGDYETPQAALEAVQAEFSS